MKTEFEIGKKYRSIFDIVGLVYICRFIGSFRAFLETDDGDGVAVPFLNDGYEAGWREYKEPVVHKRSLVWYKDAHGKVGTSVIMTEEVVRSLGYKVLKVEEISYTEGE